MNPNPVSSLSPAQQAKFVNEVIEDWVREVTSVLDAEIARRGVKIPTEVRERIRFQVVREAGGIGKILLYFQDPGRIVDMRNVEYDKVAIARGNHFLFEWVKKKGRAKFDAHLPGYSKRSKRTSSLSEEEQMLRIANAMAVAKKQNKRRRRRVRWFNKTFYTEVNRLVGRLIEEQHEFLQREIRAQAVAALTGPNQKAR